MSNLLDIKRAIRDCLLKLYKKDAILFKLNSGHGVSERCLTFRFAHYLQLAFPEYCVDCDFNASAQAGKLKCGKAIRNPDGSRTKRFVDIIVHTRTMKTGNDFICFEIKKSTNKHRNSLETDRQKLQQLTREYGYRFGFQLILGPEFQDTQCTIFDRQGHETPWKVDYGQ